jgi:hypothetical protein
VKADFQIDRRNALCKSGKNASTGEKLLSRHTPYLTAVTAYELIMQSLPHSRASATTFCAELDAVCADIRWSPSCLNAANSAVYVLAWRRCDANLSGRVPLSFCP